MVSRKLLNMNNSTKISSISFILIYPHHIKWGNLAVIIIRWRTMKKFLWDLLCHEMIVTEGRDKTSWDIVCSRKEFHPRTSDNPRDKQVTRDEKIPIKLLHTIRSNKNTQKEQIPPRNLGGETQAARSNKRIWRNPQEQTPQDCLYQTRLRSQSKQISKMFEMHLVKLKKPNRVEFRRARIQVNI